MFRHFSVILGEAFNINNINVLFSLREDGRKRTETCRRVITCLYIIVSNYRAFGVCVCVWYLCEWCVCGVSMCVCGVCVCVLCHKVPSFLRSLIMRCVEVAFCVEQNFDSKG
jgi:hypothetical protein